jgi:maltose phosphorylase
LDVLPVRPEKSVRANLPQVKRLVELDPWKIVQDGFDAPNNRIFESLFSLGNGHFGGRGNHEETYSGDSLKGNYLAGIYYPDPTRVGWWKNGYPDYFAKVLNAADWKRLSIRINGEELDLGSAEVLDYKRELDMREGTLSRFFRVRLANGATVSVEVLRFVSKADNSIGALRYRLTPVTDVNLDVTSLVEGDVVNEDSNHDFGFWDPVEEIAFGTRTIVVSKTKKTEFVTAVGSELVLTVDGERPDNDPLPFTQALTAGITVSLPVGAGQTVEMVKIGSNTTSRITPSDQVLSECQNALDAAAGKGFEQLLAEHLAAWEHKWSTSDVEIDGDIAAQQGIRFNIFGLNSTFTGDDPDLNIGPKGFTGEKYGGVTYWDTEAFCLPFYLATSEPEVGRNLIRYRHRQLGKAIENAAKLGFHNGAALYPMVTINGEECHNEWEITFEEIHRNGAIAFAIHDYIRHTGDSSYLLEGGLEVLIAISRFWSQRVTRSEQRQAWVMLGVTGPNEYENNVDNNWYTSLMAQWTLDHTLRSIEHARAIDPAATESILAAAEFDATNEPERWRSVVAEILLPEDSERAIFLQQSNYLDKEMLTVDDLTPEDRPINQKWSWDRILRSPFIKQADVLQGMWVFRDRFDLETLGRNFDFYEPRTVHESSLSPSIHAVLAVRLGRFDKAMEMLLRTARLDLDDYNNDTEDGCHTTSMAGTWLAVVQGFGGLQVTERGLHLNPQLPERWNRLSFQVLYRGARLRVAVSAEGVEILNQGDAECGLTLAGGALVVPAGETRIVPR